MWRLQHKVQGMSENIEAALRLPFDNTYAQLPTGFYARIEPTPVARPRLIKLNGRLAVTLGLDPDDLTSPRRGGGAGRQPCSRRCRTTCHGVCRAPVRAIRAAARRRTSPPARGGRRLRRRTTRHSSEGLWANAVLARRRRPGGPRPVLREHIVSEAMVALGIPTTRALAVVTTGDSVFRETQLPGAGWHVSPPATSGSEPFSISLQGAMPRRFAFSRTTSSPETIPSFLAPSSLTWRSSKASSHARLSS